MTEDELREKLLAAAERAGSALALIQMLGGAAEGSGLIEQFRRFLYRGQPVAPAILKAFGVKEIKSYEIERLDCGCYQCVLKRTLIEPGEMIFQDQFSPVALNRMFLCEHCGNKRCPHATNHELECTNSNEPGQKGSAYESC